MTSFMSRKVRFCNPRLSFFLLERYIDASVMSGGALEELGVSPEAVEECGIYHFV